MIQRKIFGFGVFILFFLMPLWGLAQKGEKIQTIVIDAGHGGRDSGALGKSTMEKDLNLAVALKFGNFIKENLPDVKVVYTRETDDFVELSERAAIANRNNADVFVSIHCNSTDGTTSVNGAETFVMGESKNEQNLEIAMKENAAILLEDNTDAYDNFDPNSTEAYILFSLSQSLYQSQSLNLADKVQKQFADKVGRHDRGVQQAGFLVLWKTSLPSILVELGFINNIKEEQFLASERGQTQMALALYRACEEYKREFEAENQQAVSQIENKPKVELEKNPEVKPEVKPEAKPVEKKVKKPVPLNENLDIFFSVQFASSKNNVSIKEDPSLKKIRGVWKYTSGEYYCYASGKYASKADAEERKKELQAMGYGDAFLVAFIKGERVSVKQAEAALKK